MILAIDPGVTTGFCAYDEGDFDQYQIELTKYPHPHEALYDHYSEMNPDFIIYEAFHFRQSQTGVVFTGVEFIGVTELWAQRHKVQLLKFNPAKEFWNNNKLKALGLFKPGNKFDHSMDATRIMCVWLTKNDADWYRTALIGLKENMK